MFMKQKREKTDTGNVAEAVRLLIEKGGERIWRLADFKNMPFTAVAKALSRLYGLGIIHRIGKGLYYKSRKTLFGESEPSNNHMRILQDVFPAGLAASNLLGFTTQNAARLEVATVKLSLPRLIVGKEAIVHTRRPEAWKSLSIKDAAILDFLRKGGKDSELSSKETVSKLLRHFSEHAQLERLIKVAESEPPRVRAMLGAIGQQIGYDESQLYLLRKSLNSLSRFDFGKLFTLKYAKQWQAKDMKNS